VTTIRPPSNGCPPTGSGPGRAAAAFLAACALFAGVAAAGAFDLSAARQVRLDNGLRLLILEERALPLVSVQMLYTAGARDESFGGTGLAHFVEHMAFRATERFPDTEVVSSIYAVGGEWHGYTWLDQTTYFETVPRDQLDLALRIEADRMARLLVPAAEVEAERGAVLAEWQGYQNDPASVLHDATIAASFSQHPYRNNTIGWESDLRAIGHRDIVDFYRRHYHPGNAVLAVVGDVEAGAVAARVEELFGAFPARVPTPPPVTVEPRQEGVRRVEVSWPGPERRFDVVYRAPAVVHPDFVPFLLIQELLGGSSGVSFLQQVGLVPLRSGAWLEEIAGDVETWLPPSPQPYVFMISGSVAAGADGEQARRTVEDAVEEAVEERIARLRRGAIGEQELAAARARVQRELLFDVETTEDAAHQLAFYAGLGALDVLVGLPALVERAQVADLQRAAAAWLRPEARTIGWTVPAPPPGRGEGASSAERVAPPPPARARRSPAATVDPPVARRLAAGLPAVVQRSTLSPTVELRLVVAGRVGDPGRFRVAADQPLRGATTLSLRLLPRELEGAVAELGAVLASLEPDRAAADPATLPEDAARALFDQAMGLPATGGEAPGALLALVVGAVETGSVFELLAHSLDGTAPGTLGPAEAQPLATGPLVAPRPPGTVQSQVGYLVAAPRPGSADAHPSRLALYVLAHGYEGRLGKEAISRRGLVYWIDAAYRSDGRRGWIELLAGVDPLQREAMRELLLAEVRGLVERPPSAEEIAEARRHLVGRRLTAAQSNGELAARHAEDWLLAGRLIGAEELAAELEKIGDEEVKAAARDLGKGVLVLVE
jgi:predicted Zn-dependent peptidase